MYIESTKWRTDGFTIEHEGTTIVATEAEWQDGWRKARGHACIATTPDGRIFRRHVEAKTPHGVLDDYFAGRHSSWWYGGRGSARHVAAKG